MLLRHAFAKTCKIYMYFSMLTVEYGVYIMRCEFAWANKIIGSNNTYVHYNIWECVLGCNIHLMYFLYYVLCVNSIYHTLDCIKELVSISVYVRELFKVDFSLYYIKD